MMRGVHRIQSDHFEPEADLDPAAQRRLRATLEAIDTMAFEANREVITSDIGSVTQAQVKELAHIAAKARAAWIAATLKNAAGKQILEGRTQLAALRANYHEWTEAYDGLRRAIERGYVRMV
jgi:hypothetical protein